MGANESVDPDKIREEAIEAAKRNVQHYTIQLAHIQKQVDHWTSIVFLTTRDFHRQERQNDRSKSV